MTRVHVIGTGGTIASRSGGAGGGAVAADAVTDVLETSAPPTGIDVTAEDLLSQGSFRLTLADLRRIAQAAVTRAADPDIDGVVVTHGTDTMEESAFLVDLVNDTDTPVVFTGAQRAADHADTDGPRNLRHSVAVAADPRCRGLGAMVCFDGRVQGARGVRKAHTMASQPFAGGALVGEFRGDEFDLSARPARPTPRPLPGASFDETRVDIVVAYPGSDPEDLRVARSRGAVGVVLAGTGVGNAGPGYAEAVADLVASGNAVVLSSRVMAGPVLGVYGHGGGVDLLAAGATSAGHLNPFQSRILAAVLLSSGPSLTDFAAEFSRLR